MYKNAKIYVAGHTGLLGSALVRCLESSGFRNILTRTREELDLTMQEPVERFFREERPDYVFLCAGLTGGILANKTYPADFLHTNIAIQDNVFQAAQRWDVERLIFYGSSCVYPKDCPQPIKEEYLCAGEIEETSAAYSAAKTAGIIACRSYNSQFNNHRFVALIPNSMYGPNDNFNLESAHVLSALLRRFHEAKVTGKTRVVLWGSGRPQREFIFSQDVSEASIFAMKNAEKLKNVHYNIGTGMDYSIKKLAEIVSRTVGFEGEIDWDRTKPDGAPKKLLDSSKFMKLGWAPSTALEDGLRVTYQWYREKNENAVKSHISSKKRVAEITRGNLG